jgi:putative ABC transport system ATP-binding protein
MNEPALVLFDEPTSSLDSTIGEQVVELIREEMRARRTAAIIVTHDERITHFADRTVRIEDGRISES